MADSGSGQSCRAFETDSVAVPAWQAIAVLGHKKTNG